MINTSSGLHKTTHSFWLRFQTAPPAPMAFLRPRGGLDVEGGQQLLRWGDGARADEVGTDGPRAPSQPTGLISLAEGWGPAYSIGQPTTQIGGPEYPQPPNHQIGRSAKRMARSEHARFSAYRPPPKSTSVSAPTGGVEEHQTL